MSDRTYTLETGRAIDRESAAELEKESAWISRRVRDLRVEGNRGRVSFRVDGDHDVSVEHAKVARFVADMLDRRRPLARKVIAKRESIGGKAYTQASEELVRRGWVVEMSRGSVAVRGPALEVIRALDDDCLRMAREVFGAVEESHPALAPVSLLSRCGWFGSFPHAASFVTHLNEDYDAIDEFRTQNSSGNGFVRPKVSALAPIEACILPALCYSVFAGRRGSHVSTDFLAVTCAGRCFRYESRNFAGMERLWDFGMRELVFLGDARAVANARLRAIDEMVAQLDRWDLDATLVTANDPFFPAVRAARAHWQQSGERKVEVAIPIASSLDGQRTIACASINLHDQFFGTSFEIATGRGGPASSGCVGWGMERWMLASFAQHGFEPQRWPSWLRNRVFR